MEKAPKIFKLIFVSIFVLQLVSLTILLFVPEASQAIDFKPQVSIPGSAIFQNTATTTIGANSIGQYIQAVYQYAIGIAGILATVVMMFGGFRWLTAGGNPSAIGEAQEWIKAALTGLILTFTSYLLLATINPALVTLTPISPTAVGTLGCCTYTPSNGTQTQISATSNDCTNTYKGTYSTTCSTSNSGWCYYLGASSMVCVQMSQTDCNAKTGAYYTNQTDCQSKLSNTNGGCCLHNYDTSNNVYLNCIAEGSVTQTSCSAESGAGTPSFTAGKTCQEYQIQGILSNTIYYKCQ